MINVLLTGAGFTANFGAPLASDIYEKLYNYKEIQENDALVKLFKDKNNINASNYEKIFQNIIFSESYSQSEKQFLRDAVFKALRDEIDFYCRYPSVKTGSPGRRIELLRYFLIKLFNTNEKSIFFTLNQDLFIERQCEALSSDYLKNSPDHIKRILRDCGSEKEHPICFKRLGINRCEIGTQEKYDTQIDITIDSSCVANAKKEFSEWDNGNSQNCLYIKLHGSQDFVDDEGDRLLITGTLKKQQISASKLIEFYNDIFDTVLSKKNCRIIIIGYSFNDAHINNTIIKALKNENTIFYIIDNKNLSGFFEDLAKKPEFKINFVKQLKNKLKGYLSHGLTDNDLENVMFTTFLPNFDA